MGIARHLLNRSSSAVARAAAIGCLVIAAAMQAQASPLTLDIVAPDKHGVAGITYTFAGTITNHTGSSLTESDLFLDFNGYDPLIVSLAQLLGGSPFVLADGATSGLLNLFDFSVDASAVAGTTYFADVGISDAFGDVSDDTVRVSVQVPEPSSLPLVALALAGALAPLHRRHLAMAAAQPQIREVSP